MNAIVVAPKAGVWSWLKALVLDTPSRTAAEETGLFGRVG
jgi:hypothetical protein